MEKALQNHQQGGEPRISGRLEQHCVTYGVCALMATGSATTAERLARPDECGTPAIDDDALALRIAGLHHIARSRLSTWCKLPQISGWPLPGGFGGIWSDSLVCGVVGNSVMA